MVTIWKDATKLKEDLKTNNAIWGSQFTTEIFKVRRNTLLNPYSSHFWRVFFEKYNLVDLFCGAGGLSLGFTQTGRFQISGAIDHWDCRPSAKVGHIWAWE